MAPSLASALTLVADDLAPALVDDAARARLARAARALPAMHFAVALECRLSADSPQVDLLLGVRPEDGGCDALIAAPLPVLDVAQRFCRHWQHDAELAREVPFLWTEFDMLAQQAELGEPLIFACLRSGFARGPLGSRSAEHGRVPRSADESLSLVRAALRACDCELDAATAHTLSRCFRALPEAADVLHVASIRPRGHEYLRVVVQLPERALCAYLQAIGYTGSFERVAATLHEYFGYSSSICVDLDVSARVGPVIGLEMHYPGRDRRLALALDRLVEVGACCPDKRDGVLQWPGARDVRAEANAWPTRLCREVGLKLVLRPDAPLEAKAYLWMGHRFSLFAARDPSSQVS